MHLVPRLAASAALIPALAGLMLCAATAATTGPAVFYSLGRLRRGDLVYVTLADRRTALFCV